jgi:hypothetical protein
MSDLKSLVYGLILYIGGAGILCANRGPQDLFDQGNTGYSQGCYKEAIQAYKAILEYGESPELYFNLEEAYLQEGLISQALLAYERLALLAPYSKLKPAAFEKIGAYYQDPKWSLAQRLARALPYPNGWSWLVGVSFWGLVTSCLGLWLNRLRSRMLYWFLTLSLGGLVLASIGCLGWQSYRKVGIVLHPAPLKLAPTPQSPYLETLALGTWVHLEKQTEGYAWVVLPHGQKGWLNAEDLEWLIAPRADKQPGPQPSL